MTTPTNLLLPEKEKTLYATRILTFAATVWLVVATVGQWLFGIYILLFYGKTTVTGNFDRWKEVLPDRYVEGTWKVVVGIHILLAVILVIGGPLQLIPALRRQFPVFHRWLGRVYVATAIVVSIAGLMMIWTRGSLADPTQHISISIQAIYIISFALVTIHHAKARQFAEHRAWALRLYMVVNGVWFFRVGLMFWLVVNGGPVGFNPETFTGPFLTILSIVTYAVPLSLIMVEMYLYAQKKQHTAFSLFTAALIFLWIIIMGIGIFGATRGLWLPRLSSVFALYDGLPQIELA
ncbi:DUF2306 domain-containing protein [Spirosoma sp. HMF3257]|uniref:DUF2306 domain-containing protein n=1 Tax=Spirosoma telluris TaxID=2183553 RepID=A0A327NRI4_9BACT|nr:DUF2306 domain-containing protein [Spirosoma telluris]RAI77892.1 hypothetical protein HMF3257_34100 [Spirosoma telluris]